MLEILLVLVRAVRDTIVANRNAIRTDIDTFRGIWTHNFILPEDMVIDVVNTITRLAVDRLEQVIAMFDQIHFFNGTVTLFGVALLTDPLFLQAGISTIVLGVLSHYSLQIKNFLDRFDVFNLITCVSHRVVEGIFNGRSRREMIGRIRTLSEQNPITWHAIIRSGRWWG